MHLLFNLEFFINKFEEKNQNKQTIIVYFFALAFNILFERQFA